MDSAYIDLILVISIFLQLLAAYSALRLIPVTGKRFSWVAVAAAILLMAVRRSITLYRLLSGDAAIRPDLAAELVALAISLLMALGIIAISPLFRSIKDTNRALAQANRALRTLSECNQAIVRIKDENDLIQEICRLSVELGGYKLAWVGFAEQDEQKSVRPVGQYGFEAGYLEQLNITWSDSERGRGPTGVSIRTGEPSVARHILTDPNFEPWRDAALKRGYASSIAVPLITNGKSVLGALNIYASDPDAFDEDEVKLLTELADDLSYAIASLRTRDERDEAEEARDRSEEQYWTLFKTMRDGFALYEVIYDEQEKPYNYRFIEVNPAFEEMMGLRASEVIGKTVKDVSLPIASEWVESWGDAASNGEAIRFESHSKELDRHYAITAFSPLEGQFVTMLMDITEHTRAKAYLEESEERFRTVTEGSLLGVYIIQNGKFQYVNPAMADTFGYSREEIVEEIEVVDLVHSEDRALVVENLRRRLEDGVASVRYEFRGVRKDGAVIFCEVLGQRQDYQGGVAIIGTLTDITERKQNEKRIKQQLKRLKALREIDLAITASLDPRVTFSVLLTQVTEQLEIDAADILVMDQSTQMLTYAVGKGFRTDALKHTHLRVGQGNAGQAAFTRSTVNIPDLSVAASGVAQPSLLHDEGFVSYFAVPLVAKGKVQGVMEIFNRTPLDPNQGWIDFLESLAGQAAIAVDNAMLFDELSRSNTGLLRAYDATLEGWARALELRDIETKGHSQRVTDMTIQLARAMGIADSDIVHIRRGALLHDIGKLGIPDTILQKPGPLTEEEWETMRKHPTYAHEMLVPIEYLRPALEIPYCHHEKWDGTGYPRGLKGVEIPISARIFAVTDVWDALRSDRPYRAAWPVEKAAAYIREQSGTYFDPEVVTAFFGAIEPLH